jgi:hypothetical protein
MHKEAGSGKFRCDNDKLRPPRARAVSTRGYISPEFPFIGSFTVPDTGSRGKSNVLTAYQTYGMRALILTRSISSISEALTRWNQLLTVTVGCTAMR